MLHRRHKWSDEKVQEAVLMFPLRNLVDRFNLSPNHKKFYNHRNSICSFPEYDEFSYYRFPIDPERVNKLYST